MNTMAALAGSEGLAPYSEPAETEASAEPAAAASRSGDTDDSEFGSAGEEEEDVRDERTFDDEFHDAMASKLHLLHAAAVEELSVRHTKEKEEITATLSEGLEMREQQLLASQAAMQATEDKMHARMVAAASRRWMQRAAAKSLASWQAWSRHRASIRCIGGKAIARFKSRCAAEVFVRWLELCGTMGRVRRMTVRMLHRVTMGWFERWYDAVVDRRDRNAVAVQREQQLLASQAAMQATEDKMHARMVAAASRRWMQRAAAKSLASWQAWSRHRASIRCIGGKAIARFKSRCAAEVFVRWLELCGTMGRVRRMTVRMLHRVTMGWFERWYDAVVECRAVKDAAAHAAALLRVEQAHKASIAQHHSDREMLDDMYSKLLADMQQEHAAHTQAQELQAAGLQIAATDQEHELRASVVEATEAQRTTEDALRKCRAECTTIQAKVTEFQQAAEQAQAERRRAQEIVIHEREEFVKWTLRTTTEIIYGDAY